jgi:hypothetical protein
MADTVEKRVSDREHAIAHLPEDLDARFAGVDVKLAQLREVLALHSTRFSTLEAQIKGLRTAMEAGIGDLAGQLAEVLKRLPPSSTP